MDETRRCNECGEEWVDDGALGCPFCGSAEISSLRRKPMDDLCRKRFIECYGEMEEYLDEETWLAWLGIWVSAWREPIVKRLRDALADVAIPSLKYCEAKYGHDDHARLSCEAALALLEEAE